MNMVSPSIRENWVFEGISSAIFHRGLRPMVSSNSKVFLTEDIEGMDGKGEGRSRESYEEHLQINDAQE